MYLTNDLMNWADWLNEICILRVTDIRWSYQNLLFWTGIVWHRLSANQIVRCFKLKKLNYMRYQVDFLLPLKVQKISYYFGLCWKILLVNQFAGFFTFDLFDLLILIPLLHCTCFFLACSKISRKVSKQFWPIFIAMYNSSSTTVIFQSTFPWSCAIKTWQQRFVPFFLKNPLPMSNCHLLQKNITL